VPHGLIWVFKAVFRSGNTVHIPGPKLYCAFSYDFGAKTSESARDMRRVSGAIRHKAKA
jgi:hypothetical protein